MTTQAEIFNATVEVINECLGTSGNPVTMESSLRADLAVDSLDSVELIMALEEKFKVELSEDSARGIVTVGDLVNLLQSEVCRDKARTA